MKKHSTLLLFALLCPGMAFSQSAGATDQLLQGINNTDLLIWILLTATVLLFCLFATVALITYSLLERIVAQNETDEEKAKKFSFKVSFWDKFNAAVPVAKEKDVMLSHDYDGIHELDNDLPPWWKWTFYLSIVFAVVYLYVYHFSSNETVSVQEYKEQMAEAEVAKKAYLAKMANLIDETNVESLADASSLSSGKQVFMQNCKACHGAAGEGGVGPNLTDAFWIHGGDVKSIFKTIKYGVPAKGMLPWQDKLKPQQIQAVSSYIMSLQGTNPPNGKEPQGDEYFPDQASVK